MTQAVTMTTQDGVAWITLNRPDAMNAINDAVRAGLPAALAQADADPNTRVVLLRGAGPRAFCAGADLKSLTARGIATEGNRSTHRSLEFPSGSGPVPRGPLGPTRLTLGKPVIAAVEGPAVPPGLERVVVVVHPRMQGEPDVLPVVREVDQLRGRAPDEDRIQRGRALPVPLDPQHEPQVARLPRLPPDLEHPQARHL